MEPVAPTPFTPPRLFPSIRAAKSCLGHWLLGRYHKHWRQDEETVRIERVPSRKREEMEIVPVKLELP